MAHEHIIKSIELYNLILKSSKDLVNLNLITGRWGSVNRVDFEWIDPEESKSKGKRFSSQRKIKQVYKVKNPNIQLTPAECNDKLNQYQFLICKMLLSFQTFEIPTRPLDAAELAECKKLFQGGFDIGAQQAFDIPPTMVECVIPVALMRLLLAVHRVWLHPSWTIMVHGKEECPWDYFSKHWCDIILAA